MATFENISTLYLETSFYKGSELIFHASDSTEILLWLRLLHAFSHVHMVIQHSKHKAVLARAVSLEQVGPIPQQMDDTLCVSILCSKKWRLLQVTGKEHDERSVKEIMRSMKTKGINS